MSAAIAHCSSPLAKASRYASEKAWTAAGRDEALGIFAPWVCRSTRRTEASKMLLLWVGATAGIEGSLFELGFRLKGQRRRKGLLGCFALSGILLHGCRIRLDVDLLSCCCTSWRCSAASCWSKLCSAACLLGWLSWLPPTTRMQPASSLVDCKASLLRGLTIRPLAVRRTSAGETARTFGCSGPEVVTLLLSAL